jgi:hypothetical protein
MRRRITRDPHWLNLFYPGTCRRCGATIPVHGRAWYYPSTKAVYCEKDECGGQESRDFSAAVADERAYSAGY